MRKDTESHSYPRDTLLEKIGPSVHRGFGVDTNDAPIGAGTGFIVGQERYLVTNYHVLETTPRGFLCTTSKVSYPIDQVMALDKAEDIIICSLRDLPKDLPYLSLSSQIPAIGEPVAVIGYPGAGSVGMVGPIRSYGRVSAIWDNVSTYGTAIEITAPLLKGSSGSPVVTMNGAVIGVATATWKHSSIAIPSSVVQGMVASADQPLIFPEILLNKNIAAADDLEDGYDPVAFWRSKWPGY